MLQVRFKLRNFFQPRSYFNLGYFAILKRAILIFGVWLKIGAWFLGGSQKELDAFLKRLKGLFPFLFFTPSLPPSISSPPQLQARKRK